MHGEEDGKIASDFANGLQNSDQNYAVVHIRGSMQSKNSVVGPPSAVLVCSYFPQYIRFCRQFAMPQQAVNHDVANKEYFSRRSALAQQIVYPTLLAHKQGIGNRVREPPVDLLWHGVVKAAQPGLNVGDRNAHLDRDQRRRKRRIHVSHDHHDGRFVVREHRLNTLHHFRGLYRMGGAADFQIDVGEGKPQLRKEISGELVVIVLSGVHQEVLKFRVLAQFRNQRRDLHKVRPRPHHAENAHRSAALPWVHDFYDISFNTFETPRRSPLPDLPRADENRTLSNPRKRWLRTGILPMKLSVVMPVYNESATLRQIVDRVLAVSLELELICVDDGSSDGSREILEQIVQARPREIKVLLQPRNLGKGAALRRGIAEATGDFVVIQDADLEYDPAEYPQLIEPLLAGRADVVYGSRFLGAGPHRVLYFWHSVGNQFLTLVSNMLTNLNMTDMETCYKVFRREVIQSIPLEENRFGFEPEVTVKIAKRRLRVYEVGISYSGRTYEEGKKIGWRDGFRALWVLFKYSLG